MIFDRRQAAQLLLATGTAALTAPRAFAKTSESVDGVTRAHGTSLLGELKYGADFKHYDYVNPDAPKGGKVQLAVQGAFDSFNPFIVKGNPERSLGLMYDTLMTSPLDQGGTEYGRLAEWSEWPDDYSWVAFKLRDGAYFHDGKPITPADVIFSFNTLVKEGAPFYRFYYANVAKVTDEGDGIVRFEFDEKNNKELPHIVGQLVVLPKHYWEENDFAQSSLDRPIGSGPYKIGDFEANRFVEYERAEDYWGADIPVNVGQNNFDRIRFEYYKDDSAVFDSFKTGSTYFRAENSSKRWALEYNFPALEDGKIEKLEVETEARFADKRVREAISLAYDFEWSNKALFYGQYGRPSSYFQGTEDLMSADAPKGIELELLKEHADALDPRLFEEPFINPKTDGSGRPDRRALRKARKLLTEAGMTTKNGVLLDQDGEAFELEFLLVSKLSERVVAPFITNVERLGIKASIRTVDVAQYTQRRDAYDFDMIIDGVSNSASPGNEQREFWGSDAADQPGGRNRAGVRNPVVDALIDKIIFAKDRDELSAASRALDRVLLWENYNIFQLYTPFERIAYWKEKVEPPKEFPSQDYGFPTIWWSAEAESEG